MSISPQPQPPAKKQRPDPSTEALSTIPPPSASTSTQKPMSKPQPQQRKKGRKNKRPLPEAYSPADVTYRDVGDFLGWEYVDQVLARRDGSEWEAPDGLGQWEIVTADVEAFTVSGESLSLYQPPGSTKKWAIITPFAHPGDKIRCRIHKHDRFCSFADLVEILEYSEEFRGGEGDRRVHPEGGCKYFGECGGCQLQPLPYPLQLAHKKKTVHQAYARYSNLPPSSIPTIQDTIGSPKQWGYRTKITPHFDAPQKWARKAGVDGTNVDKTGEVGGEEDEMNEKREWECRIGFDRKGRPGVMDIEECPIATPVLNVKMTEERQRVKDTIYSFKRGATLLLRDSLPPPNPIPTLTSPFDPLVQYSEDDPNQHVAITNSREAVYERVGNFLFSFAGGSFFQNNNSILVPLVEYVREAIFPSTPNSITPNLNSDSDTTLASTAKARRTPTHLVDTYCGSGLFSISLSPYFQKIAGVEISNDSIVAARKNAEMNGLSGERAEWLTGKAEELFGGLPGKGFKGEESCVVVDPPRKGCDTLFLEQLLAFQPLTIVYVSCNVHTQARDVGWLIQESEKRAKISSAPAVDETSGIEGEGMTVGNEEGEVAKHASGGRYVLESLRGFDLFPQTAHVESVAVLRLVD